MLERSHGRMLEQIAELQTGASAIVRQQADADSIDAVDRALSFLEGPGARHERDEEESLFPRLRRHLELLSLLDDLVADHNHHASLVAQLRSLRSGWSRLGPDAGLGAAFAMAANELARAYRNHIEREEHDLLPAAKELLSAAEVDELTREMRARRGKDEGSNVPVPPRSPALGSAKRRVR